MGRSLAKPRSEDAPTVVHPLGTLIIYGNAGRKRPKLITYSICR